MLARGMNPDDMHLIGKAYTNAGFTSSLLTNGTFVCRSRNGYPKNLRKLTPEQVLSATNAKSELDLAKERIAELEAEVERLKDGGLIYEAVNTTNDELHYPLGLFESAERLRALLISACPSESITDDAQEQEIIEIQVRSKNGWDQNRNAIFEIKRTEIYFDEADEYVWESEIIKELPNEKV